MPLYELLCTGCGHRHTAFLRMRERDAARCPRGCRARQETDHAAQGAPKAERSWDGLETKSMQLCFDPSGLPELKREVPSIELDPTGAVVYRSDRHQRQVLKEIERAKTRYLEEALSACDLLEQEEGLDAERAAEAVRERFGVA